MPLRRRFSRRRRERFEWLFSGIVTPNVVAAGALGTQSLLTQASLEEFPGGRMVRTLGTIFVSPSSAPAAATGYGVILGLTPNENVSAIGFDPELQPDHKWLWWNACFPQIGGTGAADQNAARWAGYFRFDIDRKTIWKYRDDQFLSLQVKNSASSGASIQYSFFFRHLIAAGAR